MSQYANYAIDSQSYDTTRVPVGLEIILGCLARTGISLHEQSVLETGCGTGNYLRALRPELGTMTGIDFSEPMLEQARAKVADDVRLVSGSVLDLPFNDESFDGVICNQVIHHLEQGPGPDDDPVTWRQSNWSAIADCFREAHRVLRPGGAVVLNISQHHQHRDGFWWADLVPTAVERINCRLPTVDEVRQLLVNAGFEIAMTVVDIEGVLQGSAYLDPHGPFDPGWRTGDSTWSLTTESELAAGLERLQAMHDDGTVNAFLTEREDLRRRIGQSTFLCARKTFSSAIRSANPNSVPER